MIRWYTIGVMITFYKNEGVVMFVLVANQHQSKHTHCFTPLHSALLVANNRRRSKPPHAQRSERERGEGGKKRGGRSADTVAGADTGTGASTVEQLKLSEKQNQVAESTFLS